MGSEGHWVTLTLEKSPEGSLKWYGLDSWRNNTDRFPTHIQVLDAILTNPQEFAQNAYNILAGDDLGRKGNWFNNDGTVKDPQDESRLKSEENQIKYIRRISYAADFFTRAGWTNQSHPNEFAAVRALATFYSNLGATKQDPRLQKVLQVVSA